MKRSILVGVVSVITMIFMGCSSAGSLQATKSSAPEIVLSSALKLDKKGVVEIQGKDFQPESEVILLFTTNDGVQSDIGYALKPGVSVGADGNWKTSWSYGRFVGKKLVSEGSYVLTAVDGDYNQLCEVSFKFVK